MKVIIESIRNGWIVWEDDEENRDFWRRTGFTYDLEADKHSEVATFSQLLSYLNDSFGPSTSRYDEARIYINIRPGDKCETKSR